MVPQICPGGILRITSRTKTSSSFSKKSPPFRESSPLKTRWRMVIHHKFNTLLDTPYWRECREKVDLAGAEGVIEYYRKSGPGETWSHGVVDSFDFATVTGYSQLLVGQNVLRRAKVYPTPTEPGIPSEHFARNRQLGIRGFSVKEMLQFGRDPRNTWNSDPGSLHNDRAHGQAFSLPSPSGHRLTASTAPCTSGSIWSARFLPAGSQS